MGAQLHKSIHDPSGKDFSNEAEAEDELKQARDLSIKAIGQLINIMEARMHSVMEMELVTLRVDLQEARESAIREAIIGSLEHILSPETLAELENKLRSSRVWPSDLIDIPKIEADLELELTVTGVDRQEEKEEVSLKPAEYGTRERTIAPPAANFIVPGAQGIFHAVTPLLQSLQQQITGGHHKGGKHKGHRHLDRLMWNAAQGSIDMVFDMARSRIGNTFKVTEQYVKQEASLERSTKLVNTRKFTCDVTDYRRQMDNQLEQLAGTIHTTLNEHLQSVMNRIRDTLHANFIAQLLETVESLQADLVTRRESADKSAETRLQLEQLNESLTIMLRFLALPPQQAIRKSLPAL